MGRQVNEEFANEDVRFEIDLNNKDTFGYYFSVQNCTFYALGAAHICLIFSLQISENQIHAKTEF